MPTTQLGMTFLTSKDNLYSYTYDRSSPDFATLLFLHGFPSNKEDWKLQKEHFRALGYGIVLVDLLGFGRSNPSMRREDYHLKSMSAEIIEILDHLRVKDPIVGIGHDLGTMLLSRIAAYHPTRVQATVYLAVGPHKPLDVNAINRLTKSVLGYEYLGYISWMTTDQEAQRDLEIHARSVMELMFCDDHELWRTALRPSGAMKEFVTSDRHAKVGSWCSKEMRERHLELYERPGGYQGAIDWYNMMAKNQSVADEINLKGQMMEKPALLIVPEHEKMQQKESLVLWHTDLAIQALACGHWVHLEKANEINLCIEEFIASLNPRAMPHIGK